MRWFLIPGVVLLWAPSSASMEEVAGILEFLVNDVRYGGVS